MLVLLVSTRKILKHFDKKAYTSWHVKGITRCAGHERLENDLLCVFILNETLQFGVTACIQNHWNDLLHEFNFTVRKENSLNSQYKIREILIIFETGIAVIY